MPRPAPADLCRVLRLLIRVRHRLLVHRIDRIRGVDHVNGLLYLIVGALLFDLGPDGAVCVDDLDASNPNRFTYNRHFSPFSPVTGNVAGRAVLLFTRGI